MILNIPPIIFLNIFILIMPVLLIAFNELLDELPIFVTRSIVGFFFIISIAILIHLIFLDHILNYILSINHIILTVMMLSLIVGITLTNIIYKNNVETKYSGFNLYELIALIIYSIILFNSLLIILYYWLAFAGIIILLIFSSIFVLISIYLYFLSIQNEHKK